MARLTQQLAIHVEGPTKGLDRLTAFLTSVEELLELAPKPVKAEVVTPSAGSLSNFIRFNDYAIAEVVTRVSNADGDAVLVRTEVMPILSGLESVFIFCVNNIPGGAAMRIEDGWPVLSPNYAVIAPEDMRFGESGHVLKPGLKVEFLPVAGDTA